MRDDIDDIRQTIERCRRLAKATSDAEAATGLRQMADDLQHSLDLKAVEAAGNLTGGNQARGRPSR